MVGDWMGSIYGVNGSRFDWHLFLDHDGRYERAVRRDPDYERRDTGRWEFDEAEKVLQIISDAPDESNRASSGWRVLAITSCEDSNVLQCQRSLLVRLRPRRGQQLLAGP